MFVEKRQIVLWHLLAKPDVPLYIIFKYEPYFKSVTLLLSIIHLQAAAVMSFREFTYIQALPL